MSNFLHDIDWAVAMRSDLLTIVFKGFTFMGYGNFLLVLVAAGYWCYDKKIFSRAGLWLLFSALLNGFLKDAFKDPRPDAFYQLDAAIGKSFGFPSGHAQIAVVVWFWIAWEVKKKWTWIFCSVVVAGICISRLYLGVHDVEDVLGGAAVGLASLFVFKFITGNRFQWWREVHPLLQIAVIAAIGLLCILLWPGEMVPDKIIAYYAFLIVFWAGVLYERVNIRLILHAVFWRTISSGLTGLALLILVRWGFAKTLDYFGSYYLPLKIAEAVMSGLVITIIAPVLFQMLHLAEKGSYE